MSSYLKYSKNKYNFPNISFNIDDGTLNRFHRIDLKSLYQIILL